mgnify:FL=1
MINIQDEYRGLLSGILHGGTQKDDRTGTGTKSVFGRVLQHDMELGFPLLTAKKIYFKHAVTELLWILSGYTDINYLHKHGVTYWDDDFNRHNSSDGTLGPVYGKQLRNFNGFDQLATLLKQIREEPTSRRMLASYWNPNDLSAMALPPCHYSFQIYVNSGKLDLAWNQRSADTFLGLPYDIAMYGLLLQMLAKGAGYKPGRLIAFLGDCHIYNNHTEQVKEYLSRKDGKLPKVILKRGLALDDKSDRIFWCPAHEDIELIDYEPQQPIKAPLST